MRFVEQWLATTIAIALVIFFVPTIRTVGNTYAAVIFTALVLALVNISIKPLLQILALPLTILTLGLFSLFVNAFALEIASTITQGIVQVGIIVPDFGTAMWAALLISIFSWFLDMLIQ